MGVETDSGRAAVALSHRAISLGPLVTVKKEISLFFFFLQFSQTQASEYSLQRCKDITSWPVCQEQEWRLDVNPFQGAHF